MIDMKTFILNMPKAELHIHLEGTIQPTMLLEMAKRNKIHLKYKNEAEIMAAQDYGHPHLANFLKHHYERVKVIRTSQDLYDITEALLHKCSKENIRHIEIMFDPQVHIEQGISFEEMIEGIHQGCLDGERKYNVSSELIMCANRDRPPDDAMLMLKLANSSTHREHIIGVGLDSDEQDNPPTKFLDFFNQAREEGYRLTVHCDVDQEDSKEHIHQCVHLLKVERIDHGVNCLEDSNLVDDIKEKNICLTMCPTWRLSDPGPRRVKRMRTMFDLGLLVTVNTDDPEEFASGYLSNTMIEVQKSSNYSPEEMIKLMHNAFTGSWLDEDKRQKYIGELELYASNQGIISIG